MWQKRSYKRIFRMRGRERSYGNFSIAREVGEIAISLETPFAHVTLHASKAANYSAQAAVIEFLGKPAVFRVHLEICYLAGAPENAIRITVQQNKKTIQPTSENRSAYFPPSDESTQVSNNGERIDLEFPAERIDTSELTIRILTPDGQHAETVWNPCASSRRCVQVVRHEKAAEQKP